MTKEKSVTQGPACGPGRSEGEEMINEAMSLVLYHDTEEIG
jgi:hypothetical protein